MTTTVAMATTVDDARAMEAIVEHHAELLTALSTRVEGLVTAAMKHDVAAFTAARDVLTRWCEHELVPHAAAEEQTLYPAAGAVEAGRLLVAAMIEEHATIRRLVAGIAATHEPVVGAAAGVALRVVFQGHMTRENEQIVPLLAGDPGIALADLLEGMHGALTTSTPHDEDVTAVDGHGGHSCGCHEVDEGIPELDARMVPHAIRHATIFGALHAVRPGQGMVLVAPHDPLPLLAQIEQRDPGAFTVEYLEQGPEAWRLQFVRTA